MFRTSTFTGELKSCAEGRMEWMALDEMRRGSLTPPWRSTSASYWRTMFRKPAAQRKWTADVIA